MKIRKTTIVVSILLIVSIATAKAQTEVISHELPKDWFNLDPDLDNIHGISTERAYKELLEGRASKTVLVAVIDSGIDPDHEDLKESIWVNANEIDGNGIDDDNNGYIDDMNGWNFIGNSSGENVAKDSYEITREYVRLKSKYDILKKIKKRDRNEYKYYQRINKEFLKERAEIEQQYVFFSGYREAYLTAVNFFDAYFNHKDYTQKDVIAVEESNMGITQAKGIMMFAYANGLDKKEIEKSDKYFDKMLNYAYNVDFDPRSIVGDNYADMTEKYYGNSDVEGPDASHGTHVAGIIAANRFNNLGIKGIADNVKILAIRAVPSGDERDKDIANAIYYAVDNGAKIINMSFGKSYSPHKKIVDKAVKYAGEKNVLIVHAAGNDAENLNKSVNYPNRKYQESKSEANLWLEVGASSASANEYLAADFSNYSRTDVDVFAPGVNIYSTTPNNAYESNDGTSMAAPVVSGLAALLMSYFPDLEVIQIRDIIISSVIDHSDLMVHVPNGGGKVKQVRFGELCATGGIVNALKAVKLALELEAKTIAKTE